MVEWLASGFANGRVVDGIVVLMLLESTALFLLRKRLGHGLSTPALAATLAAGAALLMALRAALTGESWTGVALWLVIALLAHLVDLKLRWNRLQVRSSHLE